ncbi:26S proteasome regulatory subunit N5 [Nematocida homosporus]|uniref:26S proteasome regulatory subunit N5 n=1 Tax=Nematocida homosporus TaxID=1912981 RepID=UPI00221FB42F|nr:26S proteasome regulatory subunit N5 [Nematocida homosporus]KAI5185084.1 26S proteasome regulatory subunit N5 [Nematocida homosporus]
MHNMDSLLEQEKHFRLNGEKEQSTRILQELVDHSLPQGSESLLETIRLMGRRKGQIKEAFEKMILYAYDKMLKQTNTTLSLYSYRDTPLIDIKEAYSTPASTTAKDTPFLQFLQTLLSTVIEGKIYLEGLRVLVTDAIKQIYLSQGDIQQGLLSIYNVNVETFSSLPVDEVLKYQLEQMRLSILAKDHEKAGILANRISQRQLQEVPSLKPAYLNRMIFVYLGKKEYFNVAAIFQEMTQSDEESSSTLTHSTAPAFTIFYALLSLFHSSTPYLLQKSTEHKLCSDAARVLGEKFLARHLIQPSALLAVLNQSEIFPELINYHQKEIERTILQHNLRVVSSYYTRITIQRMSEIFQMPEKEITDLITEMIRAKLINAEIDQISSTLTIHSNQNELAEWTSSIEKWLDLLIKISHRISKTEQ